MNDFGALLEHEIPRLRRYARALTRDTTAADDLVQECLTRALAKRHLWQVGTDLRAWLFTILHNQHVTHIRRGVRERQAVSLAEIANTGVAATAQGKRLELRDLERALACLSEEQRAVVLLVGLEGLRYEEVAEILNLPIGTVRSRLSRGREALRQLTDPAGRPGHSPDSRRFSLEAYIAGPRAGRPQVPQCGAITGRA
jgi:RNA polymerase sigma-70 factor (ECF subfamily)